MGPCLFAYPDQPLLKLPPSVEKQLFKGKAFIKKIVEDNVGHDDTRHLLLYLSFENSRFSAELLTELLWQVMHVMSHIISQSESSLE